MKNEKVWAQILAVCCACFGAFCVGLNFGWPSPCLRPIIQTLEITNRTGSYITISSPGANVIGSGLSLYLTNKIGRKTTILLIAVPHIISWCLITYAKTTLQYIAGRLIAGFSESFCFIAIPLYIGEVVSPKIKSKLQSFIPVFISFGIIFINIVGLNINIPDTSSTCQIFPFLLVSLFIWFPETPYYLIKHNKYEAAAKAYQFFRRTKDVENDLNTIAKELEEQRAEPSSIVHLFTIQTNRQAMFIMFILRIMHLYSGYPATIIYTHQIFIRANVNIAKELAVYIYLLLHIAFTICGVFLNDMYKRKPILLISFIGSFIFQLLDAVYFYMKELSEMDVEPYRWITLLGMSGYICFYSIGMNIVPNLLLGDLFSTSIKDKALCLLNMHQGALIFSITKSFQEVTDVYGNCTIFILYAAVSFFGTIFTHFCVPETYGKSFDDIQVMLEKNRSRCTLHPSYRY